MAETRPKKEPIKKGFIGEHTMEILPTMPYVAFLSREQETKGLFQPRHTTPRNLVRSARESFAEKTERAFFSLSLEKSRLKDFYASVRFCLHALWANPKNLIFFRIPHSPQMETP